MTVALWCILIALVLPPLCVDRQAQRALRLA
jgi:uncharacterized MAPEG superfamily protein